MFLSIYISLCPFVKIEVKYVKNKDFRIQVEFASAICIIIMSLSNF